MIGRARTWAVIHPLAVAVLLIAVLSIVSSAIGSWAAVRHGDYEQCVGSQHRWDALVQAVEVQNRHSFLPSEVAALIRPLAGGRAIIAAFGEVYAAGNARKDDNVAAFHHALGGRPDC